MHINSIGKTKNLKLHLKYLCKFKFISITHIIAKLHNTYTIKT